MAMTTCVRVNFLLLLIQPRSKMHQMSMAHVGIFEPLYAAFFLGEFSQMTVIPIQLDGLQERASTRTTRPDHQILVNDGQRAR